MIKSRGFTLTELIVTMIIIGILAAFTAPRFFAREDFEARGFYDETVAAVRYAQRFAVATGCEAQVTISGNRYELHQRATDCTTGAFTRQVDHPAANPGTHFASDAPSGIVLTGSTSPFVFNALGQVVGLSGTITVNVGSRSFSVHGESGFVQE